MNEMDCTKFDFDGFARQISDNITDMFSTGNVFRVDISGDQLWDTYISSFPEGTNPIYRERTYHEGNYDKNFIRRVGNMVVFQNGTIRTIWDVSAAPWPYDVVAEALSKRVREASVGGLFRVKEGIAGHDVNYELMSNGVSHRWSHFMIKIPSPHYSTNAAAEVGEYNTNMGVFIRGLKEINPEAMKIVSELISDNAIYRGSEFKKSVDAFKKIQERYLSISDEAGREIFAWSNKPMLFRNTVIGQLAQDLSSGMDIEQAVARYEKMVAPENYKRTTAVITPSMIKDAFEKLESLGLSSAIERRHAVIGDVSIADVMWVDRSTRSSLKGSLMDEMIKDATKPVVVDDNVEEISIDKFFEEVMPKASSMEILVKNSQKNNFVSVTAPIHEDSGNLFKWDNNFAWSYNGDIADSAMRKAVQARGGSVSGVFRFTHMWNYDKRNTSLMDLHVFLPGHGTHNDGIHDSYGNDKRVGWNARKHYASRGVQDVDYTAAAPVGYVPVENITFPDIKYMPDGDYVCKIHNWDHRNPTVGGFKAEIEFGGVIHEYEVTRPLKNKEWITVATVTLKNGAFSIKHHLPSSSSSVDVWGISTEKFNKVRTVMLSPNYWNGSENGNKHWFFILEGCKNPEATRGIYNEFLRPELDKHRKVFEVVGGKAKCEYSDDQLSGLGFSSTKNDSMTVKVSGDKINRTYKVNF